MIYSTYVASVIAGAVVAWLIAWIQLSKKHTQLHLVQATLSQREEELVANKYRLEQSIMDQQQLQKQVTELETSYQHLSETCLTQKNQLDDQEHLLGRLQAQVYHEQGEKRVLADRLSTQKEEVARLHEQTTTEFENIAGRLLSQGSHQLKTANAQELGNILRPLQERIKTFEEKIEKTSHASIEQHAGLKEMIAQISEQSKKVSADASNLAKALKGDFKQQGNWGEILLQSVLDKSGLEQGREYHIQQTLTDAKGRAQRPDVIIDLPDQKKLIIDSKVSLAAYDRMISADDKEQSAHYLAQHCQAIKQHIQQLAAKNYHDLYHIDSPDFVMMFIPIDTAFSAALKREQGLYDYAFEKNIVIVTTSTLLATLKTVESLWKNDKQQRHAVEIAVEAGKMYDKFANLYQDLQKLGSQLSTVQGTYNQSIKRLAEGKGNLLSRAEKLKQMGAKANKQLTV